MIVARARKKPPRGLTVVAMLVCLIIVTMISAVVLKVGFAHRELARAQERRLQAEWLAESGAQRAVARLSFDRDYAGETWSLSASDLGQPEHVPPAGAPATANSPAAVVAIAVARVAADADRRRIHVQADYPRDAPRRSRHTKEITIDLEPSPGAPVP
jgi:Tfp pilus assembly protein PilX